MRAAMVFTGSAQVDEYLSVFLTDDGAPRAAVLTKGFIRDNPVDRTRCSRRKSAASGR